MINNLFRLDGVIKLKQKIKVKAAVFAVVIICIVAGLIWWFSPTYFLKGVKPEDVSTIKVFNGSSGNSFEITEPNDIAFLVENIQKVPMKKDSLAFGMGTTYNLRFVNTNGKEIDYFTVNSISTIKSGKLFYQCDEALEPVDSYLLKLENIQCPEHPWGVD